MLAYNEFRSESPDMMTVIASLITTSTIPTRCAQIVQTFAKAAALSRVRLRRPLASQRVSYQAVSSNIKGSGKQIKQTNTSVELSYNITATKILWKLS